MDDDKFTSFMNRLEKKEKIRHEHLIQAASGEPPSTLQEYLVCEGLIDWPLPVTLKEEPSDFQKEAALLGSREDIENILRQAAPLGFHMLEKLEGRLEDLEQKLVYYADRIITDQKRESRLTERLFHSPSRTFLTDVSCSDVVVSHSSKGHKSIDFVDSMMETRKKSLDYCQFPGFRHGELVELPGQLEGPPILHRITNAQDFNAGFKKFWKKLFLSEASVAIMQDAFWWMFIHFFTKDVTLEQKKSLKKEKDRLFSRIADSFVALFVSINKDVKDKFLSAYPDCLAQSIFATFIEGFPESEGKFDDNFKQDLVNIIHEWVSGIKPMPGTWKKWNVSKLQPIIDWDEKNAATKQMIKAAALNKEVSLSLDMESFNKMIDRIGNEQKSASAGSQGMSREITKMTMATLSNSSKSKIPVTPKTAAKESHQIGPGPKYERVKFNTQGRSPLIAHYLHMRQLRDYKQYGQKIRRTEISKEPPKGQTYQELIRNTLALSDDLSREYQRICETTRKEIGELEKKKRDMNREIDILQKELLFTKNPLDLKILSDRIMDMRERDVETLTPLMISMQESSDTDDYLSENSYDS